MSAESRICFINDRILIEGFDYNCLDYNIVYILRNVSIALKREILILHLYIPFCTISSYYIMYAYHTCVCNTAKSTLSTDSVRKVNPLFELILIRCNFFQADMQDVRCMSVTM